MHHCFAWTPARERFLRSLLLYLSIFSVANIVGGIVAPRFDATVWWIDLSLLPHSLSLLSIVGITSAMLLYVFSRNPGGAMRRRLLMAGLVTAGTIALFNAATFVLLLLDGTIQSGFPVPLSILPAAACLMAARGLHRRHALPVGNRFSRSWVGAFALLFPLLQIFCFGNSDYSRPADAIVVFGARAYADGRLSVALADRMRTACALYHEGAAGRLVLSGGPGDGEIDESEAMRRFAVAAGVPDDALILDRAGASTAATVENCRRIFEQIGIRRIIAVSHFYHLPRIKLSCQRAGFNVWTVPAEETGTFSGTPWQLLREVAGLHIYYLAPLWEPVAPRLSTLAHTIPDERHEALSRPEMHLRP